LKISEANFGAALGAGLVPARQLPIICQLPIIWQLHAFISDNYMF
jgi:hypothetical protein